MLHKLLEVEELVSHIVIAIEKAYHFTSMVNQDFFTYNPEMQDGQRYILHDFDSAKLEQDTVLDYTIEARKTIKSLEALIEKMCEEEQRRKGVKV